MVRVQWKAGSKYETKSEVQTEAMGALLGALRGATGMTMRRAHKYLGARGGAKKDELPRKVRKHSDAQRERVQ